LETLTGGSVKGGKGGPEVTKVAQLQRGMGAQSAVRVPRHQELEINAISPCVSLYVMICHDISLLFVCQVVKLE
jgi:hypothetical protein